MNKILWARAVDSRNPAAVQLLALTLEIRRLLRTHDRVQVQIPRSIYEAVSSDEFQEVVSDSLTHWVPRLGARVTLRIQSVDQFEITSLLRGD
jgi:hypothetical protein